MAPRQGQVDGGEQLRGKQQSDRRQAEI